MRTKSQTIRNEIIMAILGSLRPMRWSEILFSINKKREKEGKKKIGRATLTAHLKALEKEGIIKRKVDKSIYPPAVYYFLPKSKRKEILMKIEEKFRKMRENQKIMLQKLGEIKLYIRGLDEVMKYSDELHNRALFRLPEYLFGLNKEQITKYLKEFNKEYEKLRSQIYNEMVEKGPKLSDEEWDKWWNQAWDEISKRYHGVDSFIIWLIEKKGLKPKV